ncbi:MAG TPA: hypothetical protein VM052_04720 [Candidatus Limnocylindrales bacterium]|nr:hypothetical protein [Candidatus Limnocylindrales bacterium]
MSEPMTDAELEVTLRQIGERLDYPEPRAMAHAVTARLRGPRRVSPRGFAFAPALVTLAILAIVVALGSPDARASAGELLHLRGIDIFRVPSVPATLPPLRISFTGDRVSLEEARRRVRFTPRVPTAPQLGAPDDAFVETVGSTDRLILVYRERAGIPVSPSAGVSALVVEVRGVVDQALLGKATGPETKIDALPVNGVPGYWLEGAPHLFFYRDAAGSIREETLRLAGNTLVWVQDGVTIRLEAQVTRAEALRLAESFR